MTTSRRAPSDQHHAPVHLDLGQWFVGAVVGKVEPLVAEPVAEGRKGAGKNLLDVRRFEGVDLAAGLDAREVEDVVDELGQTAALGLDVGAVLPDLGLFHHPASAHELAEDPDR